ncbi:MAG TPA: transposase [Acetobacteraceae bacterium]|nr:transposase [Acetobacteraceae bacterium]
MFRLALRQTEGLIGSIIRLLGLDLAIPDHSTLSRRAETLEVARAPSNAEPAHLLVDSTGLKLSGAGEWLVEKHGTSRRRSRCKLHIGVDADASQIVAAALTNNDIDDGSQVGAFLDQLIVPSPHSPATARMIRKVSMARSLPLIPMRWSSWYRV